MTDDHDHDHDADDSTDYDHVSADLSADDTDADATTGAEGDAGHERAESGASSGERDADGPADATAPATPAADEQAPAPEFDARAEAKRIIGEQDTAVDQAAAIEQAIDDVEQHRNDLAQRLQQAQQQESQTDRRLTELREAKVHLQRAPDDVDVTRTFGGGLTMDVPPADAHDDPDDDADDHPELGEAEAEVVDWHGVYDREDYLRDLSETIDSVQDQLADVRERQTTLERGLERAGMVMRELQDAREKADWQPGGNGGGGGGGGGQARTRGGQRGGGMANQGRANPPFDPDGGRGQ